jgi:hypothetical protein
VHEDRERKRRSQTMNHTETTGWDRLGIAAVILLIGAFLLTAMTPLVSSAGAGDSIAGTRDDGAPEVVAVGDDDDDDDDDKGPAGTGTNGGTNSGSVSVGTNSGDTATGTTEGTGVSRSVSNSRDRSANTATGTTRGTGKSKSVSNSS